MVSARSSVTPCATPCATQMRAHRCIGLAQSAQPSPKKLKVLGEATNRIAVEPAGVDKEEEVASAGDDPVRQGERVVHHIPRTGHKALVHDTPHPLCLALYSKGTNTCHGRQDAHDDDDGRNPTTCQLSHE